jgi:hypothetical protein
MTPSKGVIEVFWNVHPQIYNINIIYFMTGITI